MNCPNCNTPILPKNINISTDIGQCTACHTVFKISEQVERNTLPPELVTFDLEATPKRIDIKHTDQSTILTASLRSKAAFVFVLLFLFLFTITSSIYILQLIIGTFYLKLSLFTLPFFIAALLVGMKALKNLFGKITITISSERLNVFNGIGKFGIEKSIYLNDISKIILTTFKTSRRRNRGTSKTIIHTVIEIEGTGGFTFGNPLSSIQIDYLLKALQKIVHEKKEQ